MAVSNPSAPPRPIGVPGDIPGIFPCQRARPQQGRSHKSPGSIPSRRARSTRTPGYILFRRARSARTPGIFSLNARDWLAPRVYSGCTTHCARLTALALGRCRRQGPPTDGSDDLLGFTVVLVLVVGGGGVVVGLLGFSAITAVRPRKQYIATQYHTVFLHFTGPPVPITARMHSTPQNYLR
eukprot:1021333-Prorocentrum_minimum.AAC.1